MADFELVNRTKKIDEDVTAIAEEQSEHTRILNRHTKYHVDHQNALADLNRKYAAMQSDVNTTKTNVTLLTGDVATLKVDMVEIRDKLGTLEGRFDQLATSTANRFNQVDRRIVALEARVDERIGALESKVDSGFAAILARLPQQNN